MSRVYLSPPHLSGHERHLIQEALDSNWVSSLGPHVDAFERELATVAGVAHAAALSSGTAALHLALLLLGVGRDDEVFCPTLTFAASAFAITYVGAKPVFVDSDRRSWNIDPDLMADALDRRARLGRLPAAAMIVDLYGQSADWEPLREACGRHGVPVIEDAAEALGASYRGRPAGSFGRLGVFSFNGNKIITCSGGGMLVSDDEDHVRQARKLAAQARESMPHYEHREIGYNYRMSNILAAIGRGQLRVLDERVRARRRNFDLYEELLGDLPGLDFMPEATYGHSTRWLTCFTIDPQMVRTTPETIRLALEAQDIEARPVWKPMHLQPVFSGCEVIGGGVSEELFAHGICLPSGSSLSRKDVQRVAEAIRGTWSPV